MHKVGDEITPVVRPSALLLGRLGLGLIILVVLLAIGLLTLNELLRAGVRVPEWTLDALLAVLILLILGSVATWIVMFFAFARERAVGYTTATQRNLDLPEVDPVSHRVIREGGCEALSARERRLRLARVRGNTSKRSRDPNM